MTQLAIGSWVTDSQRCNMTETRPDERNSDPAHQTRTCLLRYPRSTRQLPNTLDGPRAEPVAPGRPRMIDKPSDRSDPATGNIFSNPGHLKLGYGRVRRARAGNCYRPRSHIIPSHPPLAPLRLQPFACHVSPFAQRIIASVSASASVSLLFLLRPPRMQHSTTMQTMNSDVFRTVPLLSAFPLRCSCCPWALFVPVSSATPRRTHEQINTPPCRSLPHQQQNGAPKRSHHYKGRAR